MLYSFNKIVDEKLIKHVYLKIILYNCFFNLYTSLNLVKDNLFKYDL